jgi:Endonuclease NucS C-terminal domain
MSGWIFQANERTTYRLRNALHEVHEHGGHMVWEAKQHWHEISVGDVAYLWLAGRMGGVIGRATITTEPGFIADEPWEQAHYVKPLPPDTQIRRVRIEVRDVLPQVLPKEVIRSEPELASHLIFRFAQMTNFPLTGIQADALDRLFEQWQRKPESAANVRTTAELRNDDTGYLDRNLHERHFEDVLAMNPGCIEPGLEVIGRQYVAPEVGRMDLLCKDQAGIYVVVEIKRPTDFGETAVQQISAYMSWVKDNLAADGRVRGIIVGTSPTTRMQRAASMVPNLSIKTFSLKVEDVEFHEAREKPQPF